MKSSSSVTKIPYTYEVCRLVGNGHIANNRIEELLNVNWTPIGVVNNGANETIMYFSRPKDPFKAEAT